MRHCRVVFVFALLATCLLGLRPARAAPKDYIVQPGDTLAGIAAELLGDGGRYLEIMQLTNERAQVDSRYPTITNPDILEVGWMLAIPTGAEATETATIVDTVGPEATPKGTLRSIAKVDDHTIKLTFYQPPTALLAQLAMPAMGIASPTAIRKWRRDYPFHPVGTGPYVFEEWIPNNRLVLRANEAYWGPRPRIERVIYRVIADPRERLAELQAGAVDVAYDLGAEEVEAARVASLVVEYIPPLTVSYLAINQDWANAEGQKPLRDLRVRQAIAHAINKENLVMTTYRGMGMPAKSFLPPVLWGHNPRYSDYEYNPARARELLREAGYGNGFKTTLWVMSLPRGYMPDPPAVGRAIQADLRTVGIEAEIIQHEWEVYLDGVLNRGAHGLCLLGWLGGYPDPDHYLYTLFTGADRQFAIGPPDARLYDLVSRARRETDLAAREAIYQEADAVAHGVVPGVPLVHNGGVVIARQELTGFSPSPLFDLWGAVVEAREALTVARGGDALGLDMAGEVNGYSLAVGAQIYEGLVAFEPGTTRVKPALAASWSVSADGREWTFTLRQGVQFHDGMELDADAVLFNIERMWDENHPYHPQRGKGFDFWSYFFGGHRG
ncbi:MAG: LysM peptidoglycan-binding domain-containing protein [Chloroflexi bacterium]|nr:LysM peptidoglycan-binding domain-containing protein [Chloroflexota bacterium]